MALVTDVKSALRAAEQQLPLLAVKKSAALESVYADLPAEVVDACEAARTNMRKSLADGLRTVHDQLAPLGKFKDWCVAAGLKYGTATQALSRADHTSERAVLHSRTASLPTGDPYQAAKITKVVLRFSDLEAKRVHTSLERVKADQQLPSHEAALVHVLDTYEERLTRPDAPLPSGEVA
jgi:hypothetical protein